MLFKKIILPLQLWLLGQGRCVACGKLLTEGKSVKKGNESLVTCSCGRVYVKKGDQYRRALIEEMQ